ncbi:MAG TPA: hypothetical protein VHZ51_06675 [Ktedonobacteraceae bacterium]|nr:hypothetical protein [Ktedonobacteraceae bacterium]
MQNLLLVNSTANDAVDGLLKQVIVSFEEAFPGRVCSCFVEGSYADKSGVATSDIDLLLVFRARFLAGEQAKAEALADDCAKASTLELDIDVADEATLQGGIWPTLKLSSLLVYGEDMRAQLPLISLPEWTRDRMHSSLWRTVHLCHRSPILTYTLSYPDPSGEFYGYDRRTICLPDGREVNCTRDLIRLVGWSATAILAFQKGQYVSRKRDCHKLYRTYIGDEWTMLLEDIYYLCRGRWNYLIPTDPAERARLRAICQRTLGFENHFLRIYKQFLLQELNSADEQGRRQALAVKKYVTYQDADIAAAIAALEYA